LPSWFTLMAYGKEGHREIVERNCECAAHLGTLITQSKIFRLLAPVRMNVVCFTIHDPEITMEKIQEFLKAVCEDGRAYFTPTIYKGIPAIRAAVSNWRTEQRHLDETFAALTEVWEKFAGIKTSVSEAIR
jgi:glutamate/tyrosine decarboxylase-like PLP-dependent enzyme